MGHNQHSARHITQPGAPDGNPPVASDGRRGLPSVDTLARAIAVDGAMGAPASSLPLSPDEVRRAVRVVLAQARAAVAAGAPTPTSVDLADQVRARIREERQPQLRRVINATGVIVNTNLGRAPLSTAAIAAISEVAAGYSNLELDLPSGGRGSRQAHVRDLLRELTGADDALVVNNNAAAVLVALAALASGREVIVSRGELVEIGGGFRVPDVMRQSGARLVEVGTTNRTRVRDYEEAITPETALLLAVHPSNFRVIGFTEAPQLDDLAALAHRHNLPVLHDLGSGCLAATERWGLAPEPTPAASIAAGADVVCFSGDKLLGGPQAGVIAGSAVTLRQIERHPLMRAVRIDKLTLAALETTLRQHRDGQAERLVPIWRMIALPLEEVRRRAAGWARALQAAGLPAEVRAGQSAVGGGSLPGETLPTMLCVVRGGDEAGKTAHLDVGELARRLRLGTPPVVTRVYRDQLLLDPRTVLPEEDETLVRAVLAAADRQ